ERREIAGKDLRPPIERIALECVVIRKEKSREGGVVFVECVIDASHPCRATKLSRWVPEKTAGVQSIDVRGDRSICVRSRVRIQKAPYRAIEAQVARVVGENVIRGDAAERHPRPAQFDLRTQCASCRVY